MVITTIAFRSIWKDTKNFPKRLHWNQATKKLITGTWFFGSIIHHLIPFFFLSFAYLPDIVNHVLVGLCQYHNQTFSANHSVITPNCKERCQCHHINGTAVTKCKSLCPIQEYLKCHPHSERIKELEIYLNDANCTCKEKRCVSGKKTLQYYFWH